MKKRRGRVSPRPLCTRETMHLVLRSTKAKGVWSFRHGSNAGKVQKLTRKFAARYGVRIFSIANVGNHLHMEIKLSNRYTYRPFIRALTQQLALNQDFELVNTWMSCFLRMHGDVVQEHAGLQVALTEWRRAVKGAEQSLEDLGGYCKGVVEFLRSAR